MPLEHPEKLNIRFCGDRYGRSSYRYNKPWLSKIATETDFQAPMFQPPLQFIETRSL
jgi:hypothetical protein